MRNAYYILFTNEELILEVTEAKGLKNLKERIIKKRDEGIKRLKSSIRTL